MRLGLALLSLGLALLAAELACRLVVTEPVGKLWPAMLQLSDNIFIGWEPIPGTMGHNRWGFRGDDVSKSRPAGTRRVVCIGDSVTYGLGVAPHEAFCAVLQQKLNAGGKQRYQLLNFGVPGTNTGQGYERLRAQALAFDPQLVVLTISPDDVETTPVVIRVGDSYVAFVNRAEGHWLLSSRLHWKLVSVSSLYRLFHRGMVLALHGTEDLERGGLQVAPQNTINTIQRFARLCSQRKVRLVVVLSPMLLPHLGDPRQLRAHRQAFRQLQSVRSSVDLLVDMGPLYGDHVGQLKLKDEDHEHPNPLGHELFATRLLQEMKRAGLW